MNETGHVLREHGPEGFGVIADTLRFDAEFAERLIVRIGVNCIRDLRNRADFAQVDTVLMETPCIEILADRGFVEPGETEFFQDHAGEHRARRRLRGTDDANPRFRGVELSSEGPRTNPRRYRPVRPGKVFPEFGRMEDRKDRQRHNYK